MKSPGPQTNAQGQIVDAAGAPITSWGLTAGIMVAPITGPAVAGAIGAIKPPYVAPAPPPPGTVYPPPTGTLTLPGAIQTVGAAPVSPGAAATVTSTGTHAASGNPTAIANANTLSLADRLLTIAQAAEAAGVPSAVTAILAGDFASLPPGSGKYDRDLPAALEQAIEHAIAMASTANATSLQELAQAVDPAAAIVPASVSPSSTSRFSGTVHRLLATAPRLASAPGVPISAPVASFHIAQER
jgi:hypothetical protein